jgi:hypothetical protein
MSLHELTQKAAQYAKDHPFRRGDRRNENSE